MIVTIFGATGMVGKQLVNLALHKGFIVRAYGRNIFTAGFQEQENLQLLSGTLFDEETVYHAIKGSDAVLSALGGAFDGTDKTRSLGIKNIVAQMKKASVNRIIIVGGKGSLNSSEDDIIMNLPGFPVQFAAVSKEHYKAYEYLKSSELKWTVVCAPDIKDAGPTGEFHTAIDFPPQPDNNRINSGDLALFMLNQIEKEDYINKRAGISN